ncbi:uncharacterized protein B0H18DRAFT_653426 [Fomitopsis serialis]|uniref:uncharacterized protein n=1 Tax=Fomitopsis serialis TaxID=139415 RepID=UPI0020085A1C|nr:uncharacterized protein B0H18DRAFT_653426 [Neoantrodia serialis]KAH9919268.1 hypothetical protein B0H18DRAFT_653426 [Neoantrodia serialis]
MVLALEYLCVSSLPRIFRLPPFLSGTSWPRVPVLVVVLLPVLARAWYSVLRCLQLSPRALPVGSRRHLLRVFQVVVPLLGVAKPPVFADPRMVNYMWRVQSPSSLDPELAHRQTRPVAGNPLMLGYTALVVVILPVSPTSASAPGRSPFLCFVILQTRVVAYHCSIQIPEQAIYETPRELLDHPALQR